MGPNRQKCLGLPTPHFCFFNCGPKPPAQPPIPAGSESWLWELASWTDLSRVLQKHRRTGSPTPLALLFLLRDLLFGGRGEKRREQKSISKVCDWYFAMGKRRRRQDRRRYGTPAGQPTQQTWRPAPRSVLLQRLHQAHARPAARMILAVADTGSAAEETCPRVRGVCGNWRRPYRRKVGPGDVYLRFSPSGGKVSLSGPANNGRFR